MSAFMIAIFAISSNPSKLPIVINSAAIELNHMDKTPNEAKPSYLDQWLIWYFDPVDSSFHYDERWFNAEKVGTFFKSSNGMHVLIITCRRYPRYVPLLIISNGYIETWTTYDPWCRSKTRKYLHFDASVIELFKRKDMRNR